MLSASASRHLQHSVATDPPSATLGSRRMCLAVVDRLPIVLAESFFPILPVFAKIPAVATVRPVKAGRDCGLGLPYACSLHREGLFA
jgi:hypothetical protein